MTTKQNKPNVPHGYADLLQQRNNLLAALEQLVNRCTDPDGVVVRGLEATRQGGFKSALTQEAETTLTKAKSTV
jgi:pyrroline-5-carboxylate reductase